MIYAVVGAENNDTDDQTGECALSTAANTFGGFVQATPSDAIHRISGQSVNFPFGGGNVPWQAQLPLVDTATFTKETNITVSCTGFNWFVNGTLVAINFGSINAAN